MRIFLTMTLAILMAACSSNKQSEEKPDLKQEVMDMHDEVMPKMGELRTTQKQLLALADSSAQDSLVAARYTELANQISLANESMMDWMRNFDPNYEGTEEEAKAYLEGKLKEIKKVSDEMNESLEAGHEALEE